MTVAARASVRVGTRVRAVAAAVGVGAVVLAGCAAGSPGPGPGAAGPGTPTTGAPDADRTAGQGAETTAGAAATGPETYADELFRATNEVRAAEGLPALAPSDCAEQVAVERATALLGGEPLEHAPMDDVLARCAPSTVAAENLVRADAAAADVVEAWMGSAGHRANLLSESVDLLGVGCVRDGAPLVCAQIFLGP